MQVFTNIYIVTISEPDSDHTSARIYSTLSKMNHNIRYDFNIIFSVIFYSENESRTICWLKILISILNHHFKVLFIFFNLKI